MPAEPLPSRDAPLPSRVEPSRSVPAWRATTEVHRFDLVDDHASYAASGSVPGTVLNQWALSEHDGVLRIATTDEAMGRQGASTSAVRLLAQRVERLVEIGRVGDLGRGERIHGVRFMGDLGVVVTFREVDPLYTLDLSDPTAPRLLGVLKIPGYSAYLHPVGGDHLLGVGQDADARGRARGAQVSLFDIGDLSSPVRVDQVQLGDRTSTPVTHDHRAFLHWPDRDLVVVPVERWDGASGGAVVLTVRDDGHLARRGTVASWPDGRGVEAVLRTLVAGDRLITVSRARVTVSDIDTLAPLGAVQV